MYTLLLSYFFAKVKFGKLRKVIYKNSKKQYLSNTMDGEVFLNLLAP